MLIAKWYNVELNVISAEILKNYLKDNGIRFEPSGCGNLVHFEIFIKSQEMLDKINCFLTFLP